MAGTSPLFPSPSPSSTSNKSSENNLLSILSISTASPSPSLLASNPNLTTSLPLGSNPDVSFPISSSPPLTIIPPPTPACAACKYQRRKCGPTCPLAPFFPAGRNEQFLHVHHLFGVSNIVKALKAIEPSERHNAVESFIFEADARASDRSGGCLRIVLELENHLKRLNDEFSLVKSHLDFYQAQMASSSRGITTTSLPNEDHENEGSDNDGSGSDGHVENQNDERESAYDDELRPLVDIFGLCGGIGQEEEEEGKLVQNNGDVAGCGRELDLSMHCDLGLGFSSF